jgi:spore coat protein CotH
VDGSVRYYGQWKVTKSATDSTEATSVVIPLYSSFDFDADGKLLYQQNYGDFTAAFTALNE